MDIGGEGGLGTCQIIPGARKHLVGEVGIVSLIIGLPLLKVPLGFVYDRVKLLETISNE